MPKIATALRIKTLQPENTSNQRSHLYPPVKKSSKASSQARTGFLLSFLCNLTLFCITLKTSLMKKMFIIFFFTVINAISKGQEFPVFENGLIYSKHTMGKLKSIVDSLNLRFKKCDLTRKYYSVKQGTGRYILIEGTQAKKAINDIIRGITLPTFLLKYIPTKSDSSLLICEFRYKNNEAEDEVLIRGETVDINQDFEIKYQENEKTEYSGRKNNWVFSYSKSTKYEKESIEILYLTTSLLEKPIPFDYAKMILYSDCLIDTSETVFLETAKNEDWYYVREKSQNITEFPSYIAFINYVEKNTKDILTMYRTNTSSEMNWYYKDSIKRLYIKDTLAHKQKFQLLLKEAVAEVIENNIPTDNDFEYYTSEYYSKKDALTMKRNRIVVGQCSQDNRPRIHAMNIAVLSAESISWEVFLRAHLDIMNDRFDRLSDGSYAWGERHTYIREIEELNIDMQELILGISLRISNPSENHYYGSIGRLGRALSETKNKQTLEETILKMIQDEKLDDYNRLLMHYLFLNYTYYLPKKQDRELNLQKLELADRSLPIYLRSKISINKKNFQR